SAASPPLPLFTAVGTGAVLASPVAVGAASGVADGAAAGGAPSPLICWVSRCRLPSVAEPTAYTIVDSPFWTSTSAGPIATVLVPARTTSADTTPAARSADASFGLVRFGNTTVPPARTSTAGAAAV